MKAIRAALDAEGEAVAELETRLAKSVDEGEILSLMREVERVKRETEWSVLRIQADFAREEGHVEQAEKIESILEQMKTTHAEREAARAAHAKR